MTGSGAFSPARPTRARRLDAGGRTLWRSFPDGDQVGSNADPWRYDGAGRLHSIPGHVVDILYDASGRATQVIYANGITTIFERSPERG